MMGSVTAIRIEGGFLGLVNVNTFHFRWLILKREGFKDLEVYITSVSTSLNPKDSASCYRKLSSAVIELEHSVPLIDLLFNHALKDRKHISYINLLHELHFEALFVD